MNKYLFFTGSITILFCFLIAFDITPLLRGPAPYPPDWRWGYEFINTFQRIWLPLIVTSAICWLFYQIQNEKNPQKRERIILFQFVLYSFIFELSVLFFQRSGFGVLLHRIVDPGLNGYFTTGTAIGNLNAFLKNYNHNVLSFYQHAKGHPPFSVLFFYLIEQVFKLLPNIPALTYLHFTNSDISLIWKNLNNAQRLTALFSTLFIPFLSSLAIIPLYKLVKYLYGIRAAFTSILLYIGVPAVTLFIPLNDVFLPLLTVWSLYLFIIGIKQERGTSLLFSGLVFSVASLFSITFLPLLFIFLMLLFWPRVLDYRMVIKKGAVFIGGFLLIPFLLFLIYGLNGIELLKILPKGLPINRHYFPWVFYNLYDFFIFVGIPSSLLFFANIKSLVASLKKKQFNKINVLFASFFIMLFLLDLSGSLRGEAGRIWLPFVPLVIIPAAHVITEKKYNTQQILFVFIFCIFQLLMMQEFWVTLY